MAINSQLAYASNLMPDVTLARFQKPAQRAAGSGEIASNAEVDTAPASRDIRDQVQLSPAARQAYAGANLPPELNAADLPGNTSSAIPLTDDMSDTSIPNLPEPPSSADGTTDSTDQQQSETGTSAGIPGAKPGAEQSAANSSVQPTEQEQQQILELSQRNQEVLVHEAAHAAVGGRYAGVPQLSYETGPDGKRYAVSGEVSIDMSEIKGDPAATMKKADIVYAAALAPAQPSAQDRLVAAKAAQMKTQARAELLAQSEAEATAMVERSHRPAAPAPLDTTASTDTSSTSTSSIDLSAYTAATTGDRTISQPRYSTVI